MSLLLRRRLMMSLGADPYPDDGRWCYACSNKNLWASTDHGVHWTDLGQLTSNTSSFRQVRISGTPSGVCAALANACVWNVGPGSKLVSSSLSAGANYKSLCASSGSPFPAYTHLAYQGSSTQVVMYRRQGSGSTEQRQQFNTNDQVPLSGSSCSDDGQYALFGGAAGFSNCFRTANFGTNWAETLATSSYSGGDAQTCMSKTGQYQFVVLASVFCFSSDYGANWAVMDKPFAATCCTMNADGSKIYVAGAGGVRVASKDNWQTWTQVNNTLTNIQSISCNMSGKKLIACQNNQIWYSHNSGESWTMAKEGLFTAVSMCRGNVELGSGLILGDHISIESYGDWNFGLGQNEGNLDSPDSSKSFSYYYVNGGGQDGYYWDMQIRNENPTPSTIYITEDAESGYDYTQVIGYGSARYSNLSWVPVQIPGNTSVIVRYSKDGSASDGADEGYLAIPDTEIIRHEVIPPWLDFNATYYGDSWYANYDYVPEVGDWVGTYSLWDIGDVRSLFCMYTANEGRAARINILKPISSLTIYCWTGPSRDSDPDPYANDYYYFYRNGSWSGDNEKSAQTSADDGYTVGASVTYSNLVANEYIEATIYNYTNGDSHFGVLAYLKEGQVIK